MVRTALPPARKDAFLDAYTQYADAIFRHCHYRVFDRERARDLTQETFLCTWVYIMRGGEVRNMRAFLYRIANNLIIDASRKQREMSLDYLQEQGFDPGQNDDADRTRARIDSEPVLKALNKLDGRYRSILVMRYVHGLPPRDIAERTGESSNTVSVRIYRGLHQLRSHIDAGRA
jgi:RNA polymerase sigma-70 factor, ECF subfamily